MPRIESRVRYVGHIKHRGIDLFRVACKHDLEGIVAKWRGGTYQGGARTSWLKIRNPEYLQWDGWRDLFEARRITRHHAIGRWYGLSSRLNKSLTRMRAGILLACNTGGVVFQRAEWPEIEKKLQVLDVGVVDMLSHLEALLRQSHLIQRALLQLRSEAPPPPPQNLETVDATLIGHADEMYREWAMLGDIIRDFKTGIRFSDESEVSEQRSGLDRRYAQHSVAPDCRGRPRSAVRKKNPPAREVVAEKPAQRALPGLPAHQAMTTGRDRPVVRTGGRTGQRAPIAINTHRTASSAGGPFDTRSGAPAPRKPARTDD